MAHKRPPSQHLYTEMEANVLKFYGSFTRRNASLLMSHIENIDATTKSVENPYRFRADSLYLCNLKTAVGTVDELQFLYKNICYFSLLNSTQTNPFAFDLYPGEQVQVQIGFLIDDGWSELNKLMLSTMSGSYSTADNRGTFVKLDLDTE